MNPTDEKMLPDAELDIMHIIWHSEKALCASEITNTLNQTNQRQWKTATTHVLLGRLCERGFLKADKSGYVHRYTPLVSEDEYRRIESRSFLSRMFGGSFKQMIASFIENDAVTDEDIDELSELLNGQRGRRK